MTLYTIFLNNFHIHAFPGTKPTYDWWLGESSLDVWVDGFKRSDWTYILASQRATLGTYIFQHQRGCGFPFMERRSCFFFCMAEVENASAGLADWTSFSKFVFRLHVGVWSEGPSGIVDHKEPPVFITQLPFAMFTSGAQVQNRNPEKSRESWKRSRKRFFF